MADLTGNQNSVVTDLSEKEKLEQLFANQGKKYAAQSQEQEATPSDGYDWGQIGKSFKSAGYRAASEIASGLQAAGQVAETVFGEGVTVGTGPEGGTQESVTSSRYQKRLSEKLQQKQKDVGYQPTVGSFEELSLSNAPAAIAETLVQLPSYAAQYANPLTTAVTAAGKAQQTYDAQEEGDKDIARAVGTAVGQVALDKFGLDRIIRGGGKGFVGGAKNIATAGGAEMIAEPGQTLLQEYGQKGHIQDVTGEQLLDQALLGGALGAGMRGAIETPNIARTVGTKEGRDALAKTFRLQGRFGSGKVTSENMNDKAARQLETRIRAREQMKAAKTPEELETATKVFNDSSKNIGAAASLDVANEFIEKGAPLTDRAFTSNYYDSIDSSEMDSSGRHGDLFGISHGRLSGLRDTMHEFGLTSNIGDASVAAQQEKVQEVGRGVLKNIAGKFANYSERYAAEAVRQRELRSVEMDKGNPNPDYSKKLEDNAKHLDRLANELIGINKSMQSESHDRSAIQDSIINKMSRVTATMSKLDPEYQITDFDPSYESAKYINGYKMLKAQYPAFSFGAPDANTLKKSEVVNAAKTVGRVTPFIGTAAGPLGWASLAGMEGVGWTGRLATARHKKKVNEKIRDAQRYVQEAAQKAAALETLNNAKQDPIDPNNPPDGGATLTVGTGENAKTYTQEQYDAAVKKAEEDAVAAEKKAQEAQKAAEAEDKKEPDLRMTQSISANQEQATENLHTAIDNLNDLVAELKEVQPDMRMVRNSSIYKDLVEAVNVAAQDAAAVEVPASEIQQVIERAVPDAAPDLNIVRGNVDVASTEPTVEPTTEVEDVQTEPTPETPEEKADRLAKAMAAVRGSGVASATESPVTVVEETQTEAPAEAPTIEPEARPEADLRIVPSNTIITPQAFQEYLAKLNAEPETELVVENSQVKDNTGKVLGLVRNGNIIANPSAEVIQELETAVEPASDLTAAQEIVQAAKEADLTQVPTNIASAQEVAPEAPTEAPETIVEEQAPVAPEVPEVTPEAPLGLIPNNFVTTPAQFRQHQMNSLREGETDTFEQEGEVVKDSTGKVMALIRNNNVIVNPSQEVIEAVAASEPEVELQTIVEEVSPKEADLTQVPQMTRQEAAPEVEPVEEQGFTPVVEEMSTKSDPDLTFSQKYSREQIEATYQVTEAEQALEDAIASAESQQAVQNIGQAVEQAAGQEVEARTPDMNVVMGDQSVRQRQAELAAARQAAIDVGVEASDVDAVIQASVTPESTLFMARNNFTAQREAEATPEAETSETVTETEAETSTPQPVIESPVDAVAPDLNMTNKYDVRQLNKVEEVQEAVQAVEAAIAQVEATNAPVKAPDLALSQNYTRSQLETARDAIEANPEVTAEDIGMAPQDFEVIAEAVANDQPVVSEPSTGTDQALIFGDVNVRQSIAAMNQKIQEAQDAGVQESDVLTVAERTMTADTTFSNLAGNYMRQRAQEVKQTEPTIEAAQPTVTQEATPDAQATVEASQPQRTPQLIMAQNPNFAAPAMELGPDATAMTRQLADVAAATGVERAKNRLLGEILSEADRQGIGQTDQDLLDLISELTPGMKAKEAIAGIVSARQTARDAQNTENVNQVAEGLDQVAQDAANVEKALYDNQMSDLSKLAEEQQVPNSVVEDIKRARQGVPYTKSGLINARNSIIRQGNKSTAMENKRVQAEQEYVNQHDQLVQMANESSIDPDLLKQVLSDEFGMAPAPLTAGKLRSIWKNLQAKQKKRIDDAAELADKAEAERYQQQLKTMSARAAQDKFDSDYQKFLREENAKWEAGVNKLKKAIKSKNEKAIDAANKEEAQRYQESLRRMKDRTDREISDMKSKKKAAEEQTKALVNMTKYNQAAAKFRAAIAKRTEKDANTEEVQRYEQQLRRYAAEARQSDFDSEYKDFIAKQQSQWDKYKKGLTDAQAKAENKRYEETLQRLQDRMKRESDDAGMSVQQRKAERERLLALERYKTFINNSMAKATQNAKAAKDKKDALDKKNATNEANLIKMESVAKQMEAEGKAIREEFEQRNNEIQEQLKGSEDKIMQRIEELTRTPEMSNEVLDTIRTSMDAFSDRVVDAIQKFAKVAEKKHGDRITEDNRKMVKAVTEYNRLLKNIKRRNRTKSNSEWVPLYRDGRNTTTAPGTIFADDLTALQDMMGQGRGTSYVGSLAKRLRTEAFGVSDSAENQPMFKNKAAYLAAKKASKEGKTPGEAIAGGGVLSQHIEQELAPDPEAPTAETVVEPTIEPEVEPVVEPESVIEPEPITEPEPTPEPVVEPEPEVESASAVEPEPEPTPEERPTRVSPTREVEAAVNQATEFGDPREVFTQLRKMIRVNRADPDNPKTLANMEHIVNNITVPDIPKTVGDIAAEIDKDVMNLSKKAAGAKTEKTRRKYLNQFTERLDSLDGMLDSFNDQSQSRWEAFQNSEGQPVEQRAKLLQDYYTSAANYAATEYTIKQLDTYMKNIIENAPDLRSRPAGEKGTRYTKSAKETPVSEETSASGNDYVSAMKGILDEELGAKPITSRTKPKTERQSRAADADAEARENALARKESAEARAAEKARKKAEESGSETDTGDNLIPAVKKKHKVGKSLLDELNRSGKEVWASFKQVRDRDFADIDEADLERDAKRLIQAFQKAIPKGKLPNELSAQDIIDGIWKNLYLEYKRKPGEGVPKKLQKEIDEQKVEGILSEATDQNARASEQDEDVRARQEEEKMTRKSDGSYTFGDDRLVMEPYGNWSEGASKDESGNKWVVHDQEDIEGNNTEFFKTKAEAEKYAKKLRNRLIKSGAIVVGIGAAGAASAGDFEDKEEAKEWGINAVLNHYDHDTLPIMAALNQGVNPADYEGRIPNFKQKVAKAKADAKRYADYNKTLGKKESTDKYDAENTIGYLGKYQWGVMALKDMGYIKKDAKGGQKAILNNPRNWTGKNGIGSKQQFLGAPAEQDTLILEWNNHLDRRMKDLGMERYIGKKMNGIRITRNGIRAMSHLLGPNGARSVLRSGNLKSKNDAYGTTGYTYMKLMENVN